MVKWFKHMWAKVSPNWELVGVYYYWDRKSSIYEHRKTKEVVCFAEYP